jgi:hypothetical protein
MKETLSKCFCDTFTGAATEAVRCDSFVGGDFGLLVTSYVWTQWIRRFMWFEPSEHNTLRPRENWVVLLKSAMSEPAYLSAPVKWRLSEPFISQVRTVTLRPRTRQVIPRWLKPYTTYMIIMARSSKWCLARRQQRRVVLSYRSAALNMSRPMVPSYRVVSPL